MNHLLFLLFALSPLSSSLAGPTSHLVNQESSWKCPRCNYNNKAPTRICENCSYHIVKGAP